MVYASNSLGKSLLQLLTIMIIFGFILAVCYLTTRFIGGYQKSVMSGGNIKILETIRTSNYNYYQLVKAGNKCFLVAYSKENILCLGEIDEETLDFTEVKKESFANILSKFKKNSKDDNNEET